MSKVYAVMFEGPKGLKTLYCGDDLGKSRDAWNKAVEAAGLPPRPWGGARARTDKAGTGATDLLHALDLRIQRDRAEADVLEQARRYLAEQA